MSSNESWTRSRFSKGYLQASNTWSAETYISIRRNWLQVLALLRMESYLCECQLSDGSQRQVRMKQRDAVCHAHSAICRARRQQQPVDAAPWKQAAVQVHLHISPAGQLHLAHRDCWENADAWRHWKMASVDTERMDVLTDDDYSRPEKRAEVSRNTILDKIKSKTNAAFVFWLDVASRSTVSQLADRCCYDANIISWTVNKQGSYQRMKMVAGEKKASRNKRVSDFQMLRLISFNNRFRENSKLLLIWQRRLNGYFRSRPGAHYSGLIGHVVICVSLNWTDKVSVFKIQCSPDACSPRAPPRGEDVFS